MPAGKRKMSCPELCSICNHTYGDHSYGDNYCPSEPGTYGNTYLTTSFKGVPEEITLFEKIDERLKKLNTYLNVQGINQSKM